MTSLQTFLKAKNTDCFVSLDDGNEYDKSQLEEGFQYISCDPVTTIQEYHERLINYLKTFRKTKEASG